MHVRRRWIARTPATAAAALFLALAACTAATAQVPGSGWGTAREAPGTAVLNAYTGPQGGYSGFSSVSCSSAGNCAAGGTYQDQGGDISAFVISEKNGVWSKAEQVPGIAALNRGGVPTGGEDSPAGPAISQVSCASAGNCAVTGTYQNLAEFPRPFVVAERGGVWGKAQEIPGVEAFPPGGPSGGEDYANSVSCPAAGECTAVGSAGNQPNTRLPGVAFVVSQHRNVWARAQAVKGLTQASTPELMSVSCPTPGNCLAGGLSFSTQLPIGKTAAFLVTERNGRWSSAQRIAGLAALDTRHGSDVESVSCSSARNCVITGKFRDQAGDQVYVAGERNGVWGKALAVPGLEALNRAGGAGATQVSCASAGNCAAGGWYLTNKFKQRQQAWVASERNGHWARAQEVLGSALNGGAYARVDTVSCGAPGNCAAGGFYTPSGKPFYGPRDAFVVSERDGSWGRMQPVPGVAALERGHLADLNSVSCSRSGKCSAVGTYADANDVNQMFIVGRS
jgi:hypothetical protein